MRGEADCPLCSADGEDVVWRDDFCRVILLDDPGYPGFCRVILNAHVKEFSDLAATEHRRLIDVVCAVEKAVREIVRPDKINLASLGNVVPHLHWHVIPRFADDPNFPDAIWAPARRETSTRSAPGDLRARLGQLLRTRLVPAG